MPLDRVFSLYRRIPLLVGGLSVLVGCRQGNQQAPVPASGPVPPGPVVIYCSVDTEFAEPILAEFEKRTGIEVEAEFDSEAGKTTGMVNKLLAERKGPRADVWWSGEIVGTLQLAAADVLAPYEPKTLGDLPSRFRGPNGLWTAFGLRGRVLAYDPKRTEVEDLPQRWADLVKPKYKKRFMIADPRFGTTRGHMAALLAAWGPEAMREFCRGLRANECKPADGNADAVRRLVQGATDFVATDTDDVLVAKARGRSIEMLFPDMDSPDGSRPLPGTLWIPASVGLVRGARHPEAARRLIDFLVSAEVEERLFLSESGNIPARTSLRTKLKIAIQKDGHVDYPAIGASLKQADELVLNEFLK